VVIKESDLMPKEEYVEVVSSDLTSESQDTHSTGVKKCHSLNMRFS